MSEQQDGPRPSAGVVKVKTSYLVKTMILNFLKKLVIVALVLVGLYYASIVTTIVRFIPTDTLGVVLTKDPALKMGVIPKGTRVLAEIGSNAGQLKNVGGKLTLGVVPQSNVSEVTILTRSDGRLTVRDGDQLYYNDNPIKAKIPVNMTKDGWLAHQYLVQCNAGACRKGHTYVMNENDVIGQRVKKEVY